MSNDKVYAMGIGKVFPLLVAKAERKGRTKEEVETVTCWLTGYDINALRNKIEKNVTYAEFFKQAPEMNPAAENINGSICGVKISEIEEPLMKNIRRLDKLVDELAKGKSLDKIIKR